MRAICYVRVSTAGQAEEGVSLQAQEAKARAWAEANDAEEVLVFRDEGISGGRADNRPGLQAALDAVKPGDALVCYSLSRLSRSTRDTLDLAEELQEGGGELVSLSEKIDTTSASGKMVFRLLAVLGEFERDLVSDRTRAALSYKRQRGEKTGGDVPYGYTAREGRLVMKPKEQEAIREMLRLRKRGRSFRDIAAAMEKQGIRRKSGGELWHPEAVRRVLSREASA